MDGLRGLERNEGVERALTVGVVLGTGAIALATLARYSNGLRSESRAMLRDVSVVAGCFSVSFLVLALGLSIPHGTPLPVHQSGESPPSERGSPPAPELRMSGLNNDVTLGEQPFEQIPRDCRMVWDGYGFDMRELFDFWQRQKGLTGSAGLSTPGQFYHPYTSVVPDQDEWKCKFEEWRTRTGWRPTDEETEVANRMREEANRLLVQERALIPNDRASLLRQFPDITWFNSNDVRTVARVGVELTLVARGLDRPGYAISASLKQRAKELCITLPPEEKEAL